ncbi:MAG: hypothetical protein IIB56_04840 [Planctomycetes bacterium]|nr:hypothetical protein [Planctomycetota bacterium]MCH8118340.1 hypothetical protein [Planctomycetota bacterium]
MSIISALVMATFTTPEKIGADPQSMLWLLPLVAAIAIVYKATKLPEIKAANFLKEAVILFGSIVVFMSITALVLCTFAWLVIE